MDKKPKLIQGFSDWRALPRTYDELVESKRLLTTLHWPSEGFSYPSFSSF
jgi:hypothetical protein